MKIGYIGTYPPRKCGIATFTNNLAKAISFNIDEKPMTEKTVILAMTDEESVYQYPSEVDFIIRENNQGDYVKAAEYLNYNEIDLCILEHEFGIFGGNSGLYILPLINRLRIPLIVTFHTVLKDPSYMQKLITREITAKAYKVIVMSQRAVDFLKEYYGLDGSKITIIEHGVPKKRESDTMKVKKKFNLTGKRLLFTFGLLSRNKGIETVIKALPEVVKKHSNVIYLVLGNTHPSVFKSSGEEYREYLIRLIDELELQEHVVFHKAFVTDDNLMEFLSASDIYITPYLNEAQITSGTLSYAIGAGTAVASTPYWHAQELLSNYRGVLFDFNDSEKLSSIIIELLDDKRKLMEMKLNALKYGKNLFWNDIGKSYLDVCNEAVNNFKKIQFEPEHIIDASLLPEFSLSHILRLTDDTGIVQHAKYGIPNLKEGYCLDDNARALLMTLLTYELKKDKAALELIPVYLSYIIYMQREDGMFRNGLSFNRMYLDEIGSEDSFGRTIWALGYLIYKAPNDSYRQIGLDILKKSYPNIPQILDIRGIANIIIGLSYYLKREKTDQDVRNTLANLCEVLLQKYKNSTSIGWHWFEDIMTYDNALIPYSLFLAAGVLRNTKLLVVAIESSEFLESVTMNRGYLNPVGNQGWFIKGKPCPKYAQQSTDVSAMVMMLYEAYKITKDKEYLRKMFKSFNWFLGSNVLHIPVYDYESCGCNDGLEEYGINRNQGAESTISYLLSYLTVLDALKIEHEYS